MIQQFDNPSSVLKTIELLGDKWTILIIRDAFQGIKTFERFQENLKIASNILSNRLKNLVKQGVLKKNQNPEDGRRFIYEFSEMGLDLYPVIVTLMTWGDKWLEDETGPYMKLYHKNCNTPLKPVLKCAHCKKEVHARDIKYEIQLKS